MDTKQAPEKETSPASADLQQIAQELYDQLFTAKDNDTLGLLSGPDEPVYEHWLTWYRGLEDRRLLDNWSLPFDQPSSGTINAFFLKHPAASGSTAIVVHGMSSSHRNVGAWARVFYELGFSILTPDLRGCGSNIDPGVSLLEQDRSMGIYESQDLVSWAGKLLQEEGAAQSVVVHGYSLGASTCLQGISYASMPSNVAAIVEDCGFNDLWIAVLRIVQLHHPELNDEDAKTVRGLMDDMLERRQMVRMSAGISDENIAADTLPLLVIQGDRDSYVIPEVARHILEIYGGQLKQSYFVPDANHPQSISYGYLAYRDHVEKLLMDCGLRMGKIVFAPDYDGPGPVPSSYVLLSLLGNGGSVIPRSVVCTILDDDQTGTTFQSGSVEAIVQIETGSGTGIVPPFKLGKAGTFSLMAKGVFTSRDNSGKKGVVVKLATFVIPPQ